jgi:hypothetical protein
MLAFAFAFAATALPAAPSASVTCADGPASCDSAWPMAMNNGADDANDADGPREYATPVEVDCPAPPQPPAVMASGECNDAPLNFWYRVSRLPESELPAGHLAPASARRARGTTAVGRDMPDVGQLSKLTVQPMALQALPALFPTASRRRVDGLTWILPARALAPPDRPPRLS